MHIDELTTKAQRNLISFENEAFYNGWNVLHEEGTGEAESVYYALYKLFELENLFAGDLSL